MLLHNIIANTAYFTGDPPYSIPPYSSSERQRRSLAGARATPSDLPPSAVPGRVAKRVFRGVWLFAGPSLLSLVQGMTTALSRPAVLGRRVAGPLGAVVAIEGWWPLT
jgi:hypothetical protein